MKHKTPIHQTHSNNQTNIPRQNPFIRIAIVVCDTVCPPRPSFLLTQLKHSSDFPVIPCCAPFPCPPTRLDGLVHVEPIDHCAAECESCSESGSAKSSRQSEFVAVPVAPSPFLLALVRFETRVRHSAASAASSSSAAASSSSATLAPPPTHRHRSLRRSLRRSLHQPPAPQRMPPPLPHPPPPLPLPPPLSPPPPSPPPLPPPPLQPLWL